MTILVVKAMDFPDTVMKLLPKSMIENDSGMYPATGSDFAKVQFSLLGSKMGPIDIPAGLTVSGGAKLQLFGKTVSGEGVLMAAMEGLLPSIVMAFQLPKLQIGRALTMCKTADCTGDYGPFFYSQLGKTDAETHDPKAFGAKQCAANSLFCLEMAGFATIPALGISSECELYLGPLGWSLTTEAKLGKHNPKTFKVDVSFARWTSRTAWTTTSRPPWSGTRSSARRAASWPSSTSSGSSRT